MQLTNRFRSHSFMAALAVTLFSALVTAVVLWQGTDGEGWKQTIRSDAKGYYGYLQALFIRHDLGNEPDAWEYIHHTPTGTLNKYFCGTSVMMAPWFLIGHDQALSDPKVPHDGLSVYEQKAISIGGWVYLLLGLLALRALLLRMGVSERVVAWTLVSMGLGSTLLQYAAVQAGWSHVYSFCTISALLLVMHKLATGARAAWVVAAAALLGLIVLIRPVNGLVLLALPVVAGSATWPLLQRLFRHPWMLLLAVITGAAVVSIQPLLWHAQTGNWFEWGYRSEGFHWDRPEVMNVLFSWRRGLFLWTPLMLLPALCAFLLLRRDRVRGVAVLAYWAINLYVISSWWIWYYGSGFGSRVFIDHYPVLFLPMALVLDRAHARTWIAARLFILLCIALHLAQFTQYHQGILDRESMDREKYLHTFLHFGSERAERVGGIDQGPPFHPKGMRTVLQEATDLEERPSRYWHHGDIMWDDRAYSGRRVCVFNDTIEFGTMFRAPVGSLPSGQELYLEASVMRYEEKAGDSFHTLGVVTITQGDSATFYRSFRINPVPGERDAHWRRLFFRLPLPALEPDEEVAFYLWNQDLRSRLLMDDLFVRVQAVNPY